MDFYLEEVAAIDRGFADANDSSFKFFARCFTCCFTGCFTGQGRNANLDPRAFGNASHLEPRDTEHDSQRVQVHHSHDARSRHRDLAVFEISLHDDTAYARRKLLAIALFPRLVTLRSAQVVRGLCSLQTL